MGACLWCACARVCSPREANKRERKKKKFIPEACNIRRCTIYGSFVYVCLNNVYIHVPGGPINNYCPLNAVIARKVYAGDNNPLPCRENICISD